MKHTPWTESETRHYTAAVNNKEQNWRLIKASVGGYEVAFKPAFCLWKSQYSNALTTATMKSAAPGTPEERRGPRPRSALHLRDYRRLTDRDTVPFSG